MQPELDIAQLERVSALLRDHVVETPTVIWHELGDRLGQGTCVLAKLELLQHTGTFKARGALNTILHLDADARARGVTAVSAGNHAVATAWAARRVGVSAKILMPQSANAMRVELTRRMGAEIVFAPSHHAMFEMVTDIQRNEGRTFVHPFEGPRAVQGSAMVGLEFAAQAGGLDVVIVAVGGGGLCAGVAAAMRQLSPQTEVHGVEPFGADSMYRSFRSGQAEKLESMSTIADSLAPPRAEPWTFAVCRELVEDIQRVDDDAMCDALLEIFLGLKLAVEPAGAAAAAALLGPLRERCIGRRVGIVICGANIDATTYASLLARAEARRTG